MRLTVHRFDLADPDRAAEHPALTALIAEGGMVVGTAPISEGPVDEPRDSLLLLVQVPERAIAFAEAPRPWWWLAIPVAAAVLGLVTPFLTLWIFGL